MVNIMSIIYPVLCERGAQVRATVFVFLEPADKKLIRMGVYWKRTSENFFQAHQ